MATYCNFKIDVSRLQNGTYIQKQREIRWKYGLVDQTQQLGCALFAAAWEKCISKRALWERLREIFHQFQVSSMQEIYEAVLSIRKPPVKVLWDP